MDASSLDNGRAQLLGWLDGVANRREHATTGQCPVDRLAREALTSDALAPVWPAAARRAVCGSPLATSHLASSAVDVRPLVVYEEAAG